MGNRLRIIFQLQIKDVGFDFGDTLVQAKNK